LLNTASLIISFYSRLEDQIAGFYEDLARNERYSDGRGTFLAFAKENKKHKEMVQRTYREVITDAIETGFSFSRLDERDYQVNTSLIEGPSFSDALKMAIDIEDKSFRFCANVSESSKALLADISQAFAWVANRKAKRKDILESLFNEKK